METPVADFKSLLGLTKASRGYGQSKAEIEARAGLLAYAAEGRLPKLIALIKGFASPGPEARATHPIQTSVALAQHMSVANKITPQSEYPKHVSKQLYQTLCKYLSCRCVENEDI